MGKITLTNNFHNTEVKVIPKLITEGRFKGFHKVSRKTAKRLYNELCGMSDCTCGGTFGQRGGAYIDVIDKDDEHNYIIDLEVKNDQ